MTTAGSSITLLSRVATAVAGGYARRGCTVVEAPPAEAAGVREVPGADLGTVECIAEGHLPAAARAVCLLAAAGREVSLLVPSSLMGEARRLLGRVPVSLQPWWLGPMMMSAAECPKYPDGRCPSRC